MGEPHDVVGPRLAGDRSSPVGRPVVDDEDLHLVDARKGAGEPPDDAANARGLVKAGHLDDELHVDPIFRPEASVSPMAPSHEVPA